MCLYTGTVHTQKTLYAGTVPTDKTSYEDIMSKT